MKCIISVRFLGIILRVLILEVSVYNVYVTNQSNYFCLMEGGGEEVKPVSRNDCE